MLLVLAGLLAVACQKAEPPPTRAVAAPTAPAAAAAELPTWESFDPSFNGCEGG